MWKQLGGGERGGAVDMNSSIATHFPGKSPVWSGVSGRCLIGMLVVCQHRTTQQMGVTQTGTHGRRTCLGFSAAAGCWPTSGLGYQMKLPAVQSGGFTPPRKHTPTLC